MLEGVPFRGRECVFNSKFRIQNSKLQTPPSHLRCATSSTLEEELDKYKNVIPQNRLDDFDWNL